MAESIGAYITINGNVRYPRGYKGNGMARISTVAKRLRRLESRRKEGLEGVKVFYRWKEKEFEDSGKDFLWRHDEIWAARQLGLID